MEWSVWEGAEPANTTVDPVDIRGSVNNHTTCSVERLPRSSGGQVLPYAAGWFVQEYETLTLHWHYGWLPNAYSGLILIVPEREASLILLANSDGLSGGFDLGHGDLLRSPFAKAFLRQLVKPRSGLALPCAGTSPARRL